MILQLSNAAAENTILDFAHLSKNMYWKFRNCFKKLGIIGSDAKFGSKFSLGTIRRIVNQVQYKMRYIIIYRIIYRIL